MDFFEDLGKKISKTYNAASEKTGKLAKEAKLKVNISDSLEQIEKLYTQIGQKFYAKYMDHREDEIAMEFIQEFKDIDKYKEAIAKAEKEILELKDLKQCSNCKARFEEKYEYCPKCGTKYQETVYETEIVKEEE